MLWRSRYQVWPRMEEGAGHTFKVPPHSIEFTLPSPKIGVESMPVVDPPWMPLIRTAFQEVTLNQETHVSQRTFLSVQRIPFRSVSVEDQVERSSRNQRKMAAIIMEAHLIFSCCRNLW